MFGKPLGQIPRMLLASTGTTLTILMAKTPWTSSPTQDWGYTPDEIRMFVHVRVRPKLRMKVMVNSAVLISSNLCKTLG